MAELTAAPRTGVHRYTFRGSGPRRVVIDLMHTITDEKIDMRELRQTAPDEIAGMRRTQGMGLRSLRFLLGPLFGTFRRRAAARRPQAVLTFRPRPLKR